MPEPLDVLMPGRLDELTGGYLRDRHMVSGLRPCGRQAMRVHHMDLFAWLANASCQARQTWLLF
jgi:hypothetical protein